MPLLAAGTPEPELASHVSELCHSLGLTLTRARNQVDEAAALVETRRPVLLVVKREAESA